MINNLADDNDGATDDSQAAQPAPAAPAAPVNPIIAQYLAQKQQLADAQDRASTNQLYAGLARAGGTFANAVAGNQKPIDQTGFDALDKAADAPVQKVLTDQKSAADDTKEQQNLLGLQKTQDSQDPTSQVSKNAQQSMKANFPGKVSDEDLAKMSADDVAAREKAFEVKAKLDDNSENHKFNLELKKQNQAAKVDKDEADSYQRASHDLQTFRGNQAAGQAAVAVVNAQNALTLADKGKLSHDQLTLFAAEMGKLATNGVPGHAEIEALMPDTLKSRLAKVVSFFSNSPTDADSQAFIDNNKTYLHDLMKNYQGVVDKYKQDTLDGYKYKLKPERYNELKARISSSTDDGSPPQSGASNDIHSRAAAALARKLQASQPQAPAAPAPTPAPAPQGDSSASVIPEFAMGGFVGGLPASNFAAEQATKIPKPGALHLPGLKKFADGGQVQTPSPTIDERIRQYLGVPTGQGSGTFRNYQAGGTIPGAPKVNHNSFSNDNTPIMASPSEVVLPISVTHAKDPALAAYLFMKKEMSKNGR